MSDNIAVIRADFDRLALLEGAGWNHNTHYHRLLLRQLPPRLDSALEIGCGAGAFCRLLAQRSRQVLGLDLSPQMIRLAQQASRGRRSIRYEVANVLERDLPAASFDCVAAIATLHHMDLAEILPKIKQALKPGGVLLILDLYQARQPGDYLASAVAFPYNIALRLIHTRALRQNPELMAAWHEHGKTDVYLTLPQVRRACAKMLPGAWVRRHLLWRYSVVWRKPL